MSNFDIDVDTPKAEHINFLNTRALPLILSRRARIWLQGGASSTGTAAHNMALSRRRADSVARHLEGRGVPSNQLQIDAVGEGFATTTPAENADDRAVSLLAARCSRRRPRRPHRRRGRRPPHPHREQLRRAVNLVEDDETICCARRVSSLQIEHRVSVLQGNLTS